VVTNANRPAVRVTVIMATYNWASVLPHSIASVLDQTFRDFELLVIGDGCSDESGKVVEEIGDARVQWHNLPANTGHQSGPNNLGIDLARGDVIAYLGHDDLWLPRHLEVLLREVDEGARMVHGTMLAVDPNSSPVPFPASGWTYEQGVWLAPTTMLHDRALAESVGGWLPPWETGDSDSEADLWRRMSAICGPPKWVNRLTSIKFSAAMRRDVYRYRPSHEQADWLNRIRATTDPEQTLRRGYPDRFITAVRGKVAIRTRLRRLGLWRHSETAEERWRRTRQYKGLED
jgi:glycosyltransferase involved in cell wall biosynthesis